jgi:hypothetical protein
MLRQFIIYIFIITVPAIANAEQGYIDERKFYLHADNDEIGNFTWGHFLTCLRTVKFQNDEGPRELNVKISRLVITSINDKTWVFSVREDESKVVLESITIGTKKYYTLNDKRRLFLRIVGNCEI